MEAVLEMSIEELVAFINTEVSDFIIHVQFEEEGEENAKESI